MTVLLAHQVEVFSPAPNPFSPSYQSPPISHATSSPTTRATRATARPTGGGGTRWGGRAAAPRHSLGGLGPNKCKKLRRRRAGAETNGQAAAAKPQGAFEAGHKTPPLLPGFLPPAA